MATPPHMPVGLHMTWGWPEDTKAAGWFPVLAGHGRIELMPPAAFLAIADRRFATATADPRRLASVRAAVDDGVMFAPLFLNYDRPRPYGLMHEGRHRALIAAELGEALVPVVVVGRPPPPA